MTVSVFSEVAYKYSGSDCEENPAKGGKCSINSFEHGKPKFSQLVTVRAMPEPNNSPNSLNSLNSNRFTV